MRAKQVIWAGLLPLLVLSILLHPALPASATSATQVQGTAEKAVQTGAASQKSHEAWLDEERKLMAAIEELEVKLENSQWQVTKLQQYKDDLNQKISALSQRAEAMEAINLQLLPVLEKSLARLWKTVQTDLPFNLTERRKSLRQAEQALSDYDTSLLGKAREVLGAVAKEADLGHKVQVREDEIEVNGARKRSKLLCVGRVALYAVTLDGKSAMQWDRQAMEWQPLAENVEDVTEAVELVEGLRLVGLSRLPLGPAKSAEIGE